jgi:hypothetical protein
MRREIRGINFAPGSAEVPAGFYLVRVRRASLRPVAEKPWLAVDLEVIEPAKFRDHCLSSRLFCTPKATWKLAWFLRDFGYNAELLDQAELDDRALRNLTGVVRIAYGGTNGRTYLNFEGFAPATAWTMICDEGRTA